MFSVSLCLCLSLCLSLPRAVVGLLLLPAHVLHLGLRLRLCLLLVAARRVGLAVPTVRAAAIVELWVSLDERQLTHGIHARDEDAARLSLEALLHGVAVLVHLPLEVASRLVRLGEQREVGRVVHHAHAEAGEDGLVAAALVLVDEGARAMLVVVEVAAALIALLLAHAVELALGQPIRVGVEHLALVHLILHHVLLALNLLSRLLRLQRGLLSAAHLLQDLILFVADDVAPALAPQHRLVELLHHPRHQRVARAPKARCRVVARVADRVADGHF